MTNDFCFVDIMEAAILKGLLDPWRFSTFYDTEKYLLGNKCSSQACQSSGFRSEITVFFIALPALRFSHENLRQNH